MHHKNTEKKYDAVIIGSGISGMSTAWHLFESKIYNICLVTDPHNESTSLKSANLAFGGYFDNITRIQNTYGLKNAHTLWNFSHNAFQFLLNFLQKHQISYKRGPLLRLINSSHELDEAQEAIKILSQNTQKESLFKTEDFPNLGFGKDILAIQSSRGKHSAFIDTLQLLTHLQKKLENIPTFNSKLIKIDEGENCKVLTLANGKQIQCELLILCNHLGISELIPSFENKLISYSDQWLLLDVEDKNTNIKNMETAVFLAQHSYIWGLLLENNKIQVGGARFLRKFAGIGAKKADLLESINKYLINQLTEDKIFNFKILKILDYCSALEIRPSDELPVIGPVHGDDRILMASGFMGQGLTLGFFAGYCISQLIQKGYCQDLPRLLWPERFRNI